MTRVSAAFVFSARLESSTKIPAPNSIIQMSLASCANVIRMSKALAFVLPGSQPLRVAAEKCRRVGSEELEVALQRHCPAHARCEVIVFKDAVNWSHNFGAGFLWGSRLELWKSGHLCTRPCESGLHPDLRGQKFQKFATAFLGGMPSRQLRSERDKS